jgi:hypothetical protein
MQDRDRIPSAKLPIIIQDLLSFSNVIGKIHVPWASFGLDGRLGGNTFG